MVGFEMGLETGGYDMMFTLVALLILGMIFVIIIRGIQQWHHNNQSPRLTVNAKVVSKRTNVSFHHHGHDHGVTSSTTYYVTFEVKSGDRLEFVPQLSFTMPPARRKERTTSCSFSISPYSSFGEFSSTL